VFAGFGDEEIFPSLQCVELNGVVADRLKRLPLEKVDIDRTEVTGAVIPFAQRDTADSLLYGRSGEYDWRVGQHFCDVIEQVGKAVIAELTQDGKKEKILRPGLVAPLKPLWIGTWKNTRLKSPGASSMTRSTSFAICRSRR
jgi:hypothetical protein